MIESGIFEQMSDVHGKLAEDLLSAIGD